MSTHHFKKIKPDKQIIRCDSINELPEGWLTIEMLLKHISKDDQFSIDEIGEYPFHLKRILTIYKTRLETDQEQEIRVNKEIAYLEERNKKKSKT